MRSNYKQLGQYIRQVDVRNVDGKEENLLGVSVQKQFIPSIANTVGTDFSKYKVVKKRQFTYIPDTSRRGDKIGIALLEDHEEGLVSNVYTVFEVIDENQLMPEYLMLWFKRPEFDRYARFKSHGSVREVMDWDEMCKVELPVPPIEKQRSIVKAYQTITNRISLKQKINQNLSAILDSKLNDIYGSLDDERLTSLDKICDLTSSKRVFAEDYAISGIPFYRGKEISLKQAGEPITDPLFIEKSHFAILKEKYGIPQKGDILITAVGTIGNSYLVQDEEFYFKDGNIIWLKNFAFGLNYYIYDFMQTKLFKQMLEGICIGSTQTALTIAALSKFQIKIPEAEVLKNYTSFSIRIRTQMEQNMSEICHLHELQAVLLADLSH